MRGRNNLENNQNVLIFKNRTPEFPVDKQIRYVTPNNDDYFYSEETNDSFTSSMQLQKKQPLT